MPTSSTVDAVTLHLDPGLRAELEKAACTSSRDPSALVSEALASYLEAQC